MKNRDRMKREAKENLLELAVLNPWSRFVRSTETIRSNRDVKRAYFELGLALQSLIGLTLEFGSRKVLQALPPDQRDLLDGLIVHGLDLVTESLENDSPLFDGLIFPNEYPYHPSVQRTRHGERRLIREHFAEVLALLDRAAFLNEEERQGGLLGRIFAQGRQFHLDFRHEFWPLCKSHSLQT